MHAVDVLGRGLDPHQDDPLALGSERLGVVGREHDLAGGGARRGRKAGGDHLALGVGIDGRMQELVERGRVDARHRFLAGDEPFVRQLDRDLQRRLGGALARARLQHPQLALLDREFEVLHVAVVLLERAVDAGEFLEGRRYRLFHRRLVGASLRPRGLGDLLRRADTGDHVLALGVDQKLAVKFLLAGRRIAREGDAGGGGLAHISEHHGLDVDRGAPAFRNVVEPAIGDGALVHPGAEHGTYCSPQLFVRVLRERLAVLLLEPLLVAAAELDPIVGLEIGVEHVAIAVLVVVEQLLEVVMAEAEHHVGIHGDEAAIGVIGEALVAGFLGERLDGRVVEAEIEHRVHHAGHRRARAGTHRDQQRVHPIAEVLAGDARDMREPGLDLPLEVLRIGISIGVVVSADLGGDGEARRHRQAEIGHLGEAGALAAEQIAHLGAAFGLAVAEAVDPFGFGCRLRTGGLARRGFARGRALARGRSSGGLLLRLRTGRRRFDHGTTI